MLYFVALLYAIIITIQIIYLKGKSKKELVVALILTFIAVFYSYSYLLFFKPATIDSTLQLILDPMSQLIFGIHHGP